MYNKYLKHLDSVCLCLCHTNYSTKLFLILFIAFFKTCRIININLIHLIKTKQTIRVIKKEKNYVQ